MTPKPSLKKLTKAHVLPLKKQFLASEFHDAKSFLHAWGFGWDKHTNNLVAWWLTEKKEFLAKVAEMSKDNLAKDVAEKWTIDTTELQQMKHTTVQLLKVKLNELNYKAQRWAEFLRWYNNPDKTKPNREWPKPQEVRTTEIIEVMNAVKRELWEPLTIAKLHNHHTLSPELSEEEDAILDTLDTLEAIEIFEKAE